MAGKQINFGIGAKRVRLIPGGIMQSGGGSSLAAGQFSGTGPGSFGPNTPVIDRIQPLSGGQSATKIEGTIGMICTEISIMARIATQPGEIRLFFLDSQESATDVATLFAQMTQAEDLPPMLVPAGGSIWTVWRNVDVSFARFVFPALVNVGAGASGAWRLCTVYTQKGT